MASQNASRTAAKGMQTRLDNAAIDGVCPIASCGRNCHRWCYLTQHWKAKHESDLGSLSTYLQQIGEDSRLNALQTSESSADDSDSDVCSGEAEQLLSVAMKHIDNMKYRYYQTDAEIQRAKMFASDLIRDSISPAVTKVISDYMNEHPGARISMYPLP